MVGKKTRCSYSFIHHLGVLVESALSPFWIYQGQRWIKKPVRVSGGDLERYTKAAASRMVAWYTTCLVRLGNVQTVTEELNL